MLKKYEERQQVIIEDDIWIRFGQKAFYAGLIKKKSHIKPIIEKLMRLYLDGKLDHLVPDGLLKKNPAKEKSRIPVNKLLKSKFEDRAWKKGLIKYPHLGVRAIELLMLLFLDDIFDEFFNIE